MAVKFNPDYRSPRLTRCVTEAGVNVCLSDGRLILRDSLPLGTPDEELVKAVERDLLSLTLRGAVQLTPFLFPQSEEEPWVKLTPEGTNRYRHAAFVAGRLPIITTKALKQILTDNGRPHWMKLNKLFEERQIEFFVASEKRHYTADGVCEHLPEEWHEAIYGNSRMAKGRGFEGYRLNELADQYGVVLNWHLDPHPLEKGPKPAPEKVPKRDNGLPPPPEGVIKPFHYAKAEYPLHAVGDVYGLYGFQPGHGAYYAQQAYKRMKHKSEEYIYRIDGTAVNRHQMMKYLVWLVSEGRTLKKYCTGLDGAPSYGEVMSWKEYHPDFRHELEMAEKAYAAVCFDKAGEILEGDIEAEDVKVAKFKFEGYMKRASILHSDKFSQKQVVLTENLNDKNVAALKQQVLSLLMQTPDLAIKALDADVLSTESIPATEVEVEVEVEQEEEPEKEEPQ